MTRISDNDVGLITQNDLSDAFVSAAGVTPNDETAIMLQRLPSLGRISADSLDRQFLDHFILDDLRAESIIRLSQSWNSEVFQKNWKNPLNQIGLGILAEYACSDVKRKDSLYYIVREDSKGKNQVLAADIISAMCMFPEEHVDCQGIVIDGGYFSYLSFEGKEIQKLVISNSIIEKLDLTNSKMSETVEISNCIISTIYGISSRNSIPNQFSKCEIEQFEMVATTLVKRARLLESQKILAGMIRKIFFQPGAGRKESTLLRETDGGASKKLSQNILSVLRDEKLVTRVQGDEEFVYKPVRKETGRMDKMLIDLTLSKDSLWVKVSRM